MTASKHPQRCETCQHLQDMDTDHDIFGLKLCKKHDLIIEPIFRNQVKYTGCASHSSQPVPELLDGTPNDVLEREYKKGFFAGKEAGAKAERERVLDSVVIRCHFLIPPDILDEPHHRIERATLEKVFKEIKSLRGGERE